MIRVILHSDDGRDTGTMVEWSGHWSGGTFDTGLAIKDMSVMIWFECVIISYGHFILSSS